MEGHDGISEVYLMNCGVGDATARAFAKALKHKSCKLTDVNFASNYITSAGAKVLDNAITNNKIIDWINFSSNRGINEDKDEHVKSINTITDANKERKRFAKQGPRMSPAETMKKLEKGAKERMAAMAKKPETPVKAKKAPDEL